MHNLLKHLYKKSALISLLMLMLILAIPLNARANADESNDISAYQELITRLGDKNLDTDLHKGDWLYVDSDYKMAWFVDKNTVVKLSRHELVYWQLIVYNAAGRRLFLSKSLTPQEVANIGYTLQKRRLNLKDNTISTYIVKLYDIHGKLMLESERDGSPNKIEPDTMANNEKNLLKKLKSK